MSEKKKEIMQYVIYPILVAVFIGLMSFRLTISQKQLDAKADKVELEAEVKALNKQIESNKESTDEKLDLIIELLKNENNQ